MSEWFFKEGDHGEHITAQMLNDVGSAVPLFGASVRFHMRLAMVAGAPVPATKVDADAIVLDALSALVQYTLSAMDTDTPGDYDVEWEVTFTDGTQQTFPAPGYDRVLISDQLA